MKTYRVTIDLIFDPEEAEDLVGVNAKRVYDAVNTGLEEDSYDFFGEELAMAGLLTPTVKSVKEV